MVNWKVGLALIVIVVGLSAYLILTRPRPAASEFGRILPCSLTDTVLVRVEAGGKVLEVVRPRPGEPWQLTSPVSAPADPLTMEYLTQSLHSVSAINTIRNPDARSSYGLEPPSRIVTCRVNGGNSYTLSVGKESFDGSGYYAQRGGDGRVFVISSIPVDMFDRELAEPPVKPSPTTAGG